MPERVPRLVRSLLPWLLLATASVPAVAQQVQVTKYPISGAVPAPPGNGYSAAVGATVRWRIHITNPQAIPATVNVVDVLGGDSCAVFGFPMTDCAAQTYWDLLCPADPSDPNYPSPGPDVGATCDTAADTYQVNALAVPGFGQVCVEFSAVFLGDPGVPAFNAGCVFVPVPPLAFETRPADLTFPGWPWSCPAPPLGATAGCTSVLAAAPPNVDAAITKGSSFVDNDGDGVLSPGDEITWTVRVEDLSTDGEDANGFLFDPYPDGLAQPPTFLQNPDGQCAFDGGVPRIDCGQLTFADGEVKILEYSTVVSCDALTDDDSFNACNQAQVCEDAGGFACLLSDDDEDRDGDGDPVDFPPQPECIDLPMVGFAESTKSWDWTDVNDNDFVDTGDIATFTLHVVNTGRKTATGVEVVDDLDFACMDFGTVMVEPPGSFEPGLGRVTFSGLGPLGTGESVDLTFSVELIEPSGSCCNQAFVNAAERTDPCPGANGVPTDSDPDQPGSDPLCIVFGPQPELEVIKDFTLVDDVDGDGEVDAGDTIRFSVSVENLGQAPATGVNLRDDVPLCWQDCDPTAVTITEGEGDASRSMPGGGLFACTILVDDIGGGDGLLPDERMTVEWQVTVQTPQCCNVARVDYDQNLGSDPLTSRDAITGGPTCGNRSSVTVELRKTAADADADGCFEPGEEVTFRLLVSATGGEGRDVVLTDTFPAGMFDVVDDGGGTFDGSDTITWDPIASVQPGAPTTVTWVGRIACENLIGDPWADADGLSNTASAQPANAGIATARWTEQVSVPVLDVQKAIEDAGGDGVADPGEAVTFRITVTNTNFRSCSADGVTLTDVVDVDVDPAQLTPDRGGQDVGGGTIVWDGATTPVLQSLPADQPEVFTVMAVALDPATNPAPGSDAVIDNEAVATADVPDPDACPDSLRIEGRGSASMDIAVAGAILRVSQAVGEAPAGADGDGCLEAGEVLEWTVRTESIGSEPATGIVLTVTVPNGVSVVDPGSGVHEAGAGTITWDDIPDLATPEGADRTWTGSLPCDAADGDPIAPFAEAVADGGVRASDTDAASVNGPVLVVSKTATPDTSVAPDGSVAFAITIRNDGSCEADAVVVSDLIDADLDWGALTIMNGGTSDGASPPTVTWTPAGEPQLASLARGGGEVVLTLSAPALDPDANAQVGDGGEMPDGEIRNSAVATSDNPDPGTCPGAQPSWPPGVLATPNGDFVAIDVGGLELWRNGVVSCPDDALATYRSESVFTGLDPAADPQLDEAGRGFGRTAGVTSPAVVPGDADPAATTRECPQGAGDDNRVLVLYELSDPAARIDVYRDPARRADIAICWPRPCAP